jgi:predicted transcriptional regulator YheO
VNPSLKKYLPLVDFLAEVLGEDTEVVLHDVADVDSSVVAIRNGQISGRCVGAPATNVVLKIMKDGSENAIDYLTNYQGLSASGKTLRSSTYFLHDDDRCLIGILCINIDASKLEQFRDYLDSVVRIKHVPSENERVERLSSTVEELAYTSIETVINAAGVSPQRMSQDEKIDIVRRLNDDGVFLLKGAIFRIASKLEVSEATIYRYLNSVKKEM